MENQKPVVDAVKLEEIKEFEPKDISKQIEEGFANSPRVQCETKTKSESYDKYSAEPSTEELEPNF